MTTEPSPDELKRIEARPAYAPIQALLDKATERDNQCCVALCVPWFGDGDQWVTVGDELFPLTNIILLAVRTAAQKEPPLLVKPVDVTAHGRKIINAVLDYMNATACDKHHDATQEATEKLEVTQ